MSRLALRLHMLLDCWYFFVGSLRFWVALSKRGRVVKARARLVLYRGRAFPGIWFCTQPLYSTNPQSLHVLALPRPCLAVFSPCRVLALPCRVLALPCPRPASADCSHPSFLSPNRRRVLTLVQLPALFPVPSRPPCNTGCAGSSCYLSRFVCTVVS